MNLSSTQTVKSFAPFTVYTACDFSGYTLKHLQAMYPHSWKEAAPYFGIALPELPKLPKLTVHQIKHKAIAQQVYDFYPIPGAVIGKMIDVAGIEPHHHVLEPSAGTGDLVSAIADLGASHIDCFEINPDLQFALTLQGLNVVGADFLASIPQPIYDRVLANPPFSYNGVARHTTHAFNFLKPGGRLVMIAHHYKLKPSQSDKQFFAWLKDNKAKFLNLGQAFKNSDRPTSTPIQLIRIDKP